MQIQLEVASGDKAGQRIAITGTKFIIGRAEDCHLKPRSELISRYHCAIVTEDDFVTIRDLGSKNGVYVNGTRVSVEQDLNDGDHLCVGPLEFFARIVGAAVSAESEVEQEEYVEHEAEPAVIPEPPVAVSVPPADIPATATAKLPKVGSVEQAVARTVERQAEKVVSNVASPNTPGSDGDEDVSDWLMGDYESDGSETISVAPYKPSDSEDVADIVDNVAPSKGAENAAKSAKSTAQSKGSQEVAANLLKNFFKGGR